jgi:single-strand DNA-binding protein
MRGLNKLFLMGHLGSNPQMYSSKAGKTYVGLNLATHRPGNAPNDGENKDTTDWHFVRVFGKAADNCAKYLSKGSPVFIEGFVSQYSVPGAEGEMENRTGLNALKVEFLPNPAAQRPRESVEL